MAHDSIGIGYSENTSGNRIVMDNSVQRAFRGTLLVEKSLKHMVVSGMTDDVAAMVEWSARYVYCDNEHFDDDRNCDHIKDLQSNIRISREREDLWNCVLGPRHLNCNQITKARWKLPRH